MSNNIKFSKTSKIFDDNNFSKLLPVISKTEFLRRIKEKSDDSGATEDSFLGKRLGKMSRIMYGKSDNGEQIELQRLSELIQSISIQGLYTNQIVKEIINVQDIGKSVKITYLKPETLDNLYNSTSQGDFKNANQTSNVLNDISILDSFSENKSVVINDIENSENPKEKVDLLEGNGFCHTKANPGLSVIQVLDPNLRACFNQSQEIDAFFNLISTLDITMAMPYVKADFIIPNRLFKNATGVLDNPNNNTKQEKNFITTSLNNFLFGAKYASDKSKFTDIAHAINGNYNIDYSPAVTSGQTKKIYERQHMNSAIFLAPQTMVNADIDDALGNDVGDRKEGALIDKFRPFMTIMDLSFDVRPQKGFLFYKTATLNLMLYDKARMTEIAPFIKPELLNSHSSEITLEYGWQHNLGDDDIVAQNDITNRNPIAQFINSLKVVEKYVIVNSSYTINENGSVNISLSLAMKGPVQLRNTPMPADQELTKLDNDISILNNYLINESLKNNLGTTTTPAFDIYNVQRNKMSASNVTVASLQELQKAFNQEKERPNPPYTKTQQITEHFKKIEETIVDAIKKLEEKTKKDSDFLTKHFDFLKRGQDGKRIHNSKDEEGCNDPFVDKSWWEKFLGVLWTDKKSDKFISLGKILTSVTGKMLCDTKKYNEVQLIFYNLNGKAIRASYLNIASIPVDLDDFEKYLTSIVKDIRKMSVETFLSAVLNRCVNQKAAIVYGLDRFFKFDGENKTQYNLKKESEKKGEELRRVEIKNIEASVKGEIINQYYGTLFNESQAEVGNDNVQTKENYLNKSSIDITFKVPRVVMNFDSMQHETDPESSILRISFYDELDNPYESLTDVVSSLQSRKLSNALSTINVYRTAHQSGQENTTSEGSAKIDASEIIQELIKSKIITLFDAEGNPLTSEQTINENNISKISQIKVNTSGEADIKTFINIKQMFKSYMPSLTLGQTNSALLSGNITTNQDAKYATALLMKQDGSVINNQLDNTNNEAPDVQVISDLDASPLFVLPSQASISIIGCPLVNFAQLIFLDFNTNTTIDNIYFVSGIKHNISPGKFSTELTMVQNDLFTRYEAQSTTIKTFLTTLKNLKAELKTPEPIPDVPQSARQEVRKAEINATSKSLFINYFIKYDDSITYQSRADRSLFDDIASTANGFNLLVTNNIPQIVTQQLEYRGPQSWKYSRIPRGGAEAKDIVITKMQYLNNHFDIQNEEIITNTDTLMDNFIKMLGIIDEKMIDAAYLNNPAWMISKVEITSGYRTVEENKAVGGAENSKHKTGRALDFKIFKHDVKAPEVEIQIDVEILSDLILKECFNLKTEGVIFTAAGKPDFTDNLKKSESIQVSDKLDPAAQPKIMVGGLGIYIKQAFIHYDIRDLDNNDRTTATVWLDEDSTNSDQKEAPDPAVTP